MSQIKFSTNSEKQSQSHKKLRFKYRNYGNITSIIEFNISDQKIYLFKTFFPSFKRQFMNKTAFFINSLN